MTKTFDVANGHWCRFTIPFFCNFDAVFILQTSKNYIMHWWSLISRSAGEVLVVNNDIYDLVVKHLEDFLGKDAPANLNSQEFARKLRDTAEELCQERGIAPLNCRCGSHVDHRTSSIWRHCSSFGSVAYLKVQHGHQFGQGFCLCRLTLIFFSRTVFNVFVANALKSLGDDGLR